MIRPSNFLIFVLCCTLSPLPLLTQTTGAMLLPTGQVTVNGHAVTSSTAVFAGDHVQVGANSAAIVTARGMSAQMQAQSAITWQQQAIEFQGGSLTVAAQSPWQVRAGSMTVSLGSQLSKVEIVQRDDVAMVKLLEGSATLNQAGQTTALQAGFTVARPMPPAMGATQAAPAVAASHASHTGLILLGVAAAGAAGAGLALKGHGSNSAPVSPAVP